ncbi:MAG: site-specific integrase [Clostridiales bacterium]|nr:site-specific integrase [Clostridiales bacterium]
MKKQNSEKSKSFYEHSSWYHRTKILQDNGTIKYGKKGGFKTREEADKSYEQYEKEFKNAYRTWQLSNQVNQDVSLKDYLIYWLEDVFSQRVETTTYMVTAYAVYDLILPCIERDVKLRYLNTEYLDALLQNVAQITKSAGNKGRETLNLALKEAVTAGYIKRNPVTATKPYKRTKPTITILNKAQIKKLLSAASKSNWYLEILLGLFCGLRKGEILGLKFSDFDFDQNTVSIKRQLVADTKLKKGSGKIETYSLVERDPKTQNSFRTLRVPDAVMKEVEIRRKKVETDKSRHAANYQNHDYISCQENGNPHGLSSMNKMLATLCNKCGLPHVTVHGLRHMYATILIEMKVPIVKISAMLGHGSVHTTFEYYCDVMDDNENILAFMNNAFIPVEQEE